MKKKGRKRWKEEEREGKVDAEVDFEPGGRGGRKEGKEEEVEWKVEEAEAVEIGEIHR